MPMNDEQQDMQDPDDPVAGVGSTEPRVERPTTDGTEVSDEHRDRRSRFFRARREAASPIADLEVEAGPRWGEREANRQIRAFLLRLAGDRPLEHHDDPVDLARENDLLLLFGPDEEEAFAKLALRFPEETVATWASLLAGGDRTEAFGPRSRAERRDEAAIERSIKLGVRRRALAVLAVLASVVVGAVLVGIALEDQPEDRSDRALRFAAAEATRDLGDPAAPVAGGPPVAEPLLTTAVDRLVAVAAGDGALEDRIRLTVDDGALPLAPGSVTASVLQHDGGQVALVGPAGWTTATCIRASVVTHLLRPLDVVLHEEDGACPPGLAGRRATVTCLGDDALILAIEIPQGEVELVEGGIGWAEGIRVGLEFDAPGWEVLALRGTIAVPAGEASVLVPAFGGGQGDVLTVDLGEGRTGSCTMR